MRTAAAMRLGGKPGHSRIEEEAASRIGSPRVCVVTIWRVPCAATGTTSSGASASGEQLKRDPFEAGDVTSEMGVRHRSPWVVPI